jgi:hypothetical protein
MTPQFFRIRKAFLRQEREGWWIWWQNRYANDLAEFEPFSRRLNDFGEWIANTTYHRRRRPLSSEKEDMKRARQLLDTIFSDTPYSRIISEARTT